MLRPPIPPGDGRSYCEGQLQEVARYILARIVRAQRTGKPCYIAGSAAASDLGMSRSTWYRYTGLLEAAGQLRRTGRRGPALGGGKNPGARYHFLSRACLTRGHTSVFFLNSKPSESSTNPSPYGDRRGAKKDLAPAALASVVALTPQPPSPREGGGSRPARSTAEVLALVRQQER